MSTRTEKTRNGSAHTETIEREREIIGVRSPEGRPAHPDVGPGALGVILIFVALMLAVLAAVLAFALGQPVAALAIGGLALLIFLTNPEVWATVFRGKERAEIRAASSRSSKKQKSDDSPPESIHAVRS